MSTTYEETRAQRDALYARWDALTRDQRNTVLGCLVSDVPAELAAALATAEAHGA